MMKQLKTNLRDIKSVGGGTCPRVIYVPGGKCQVLTSLW